MTVDKKVEIENMVKLLSQLDYQSLLLLYAGAQMLKARADMAAEREKESA